MTTAVAPISRTANCTIFFPDGWVGVSPTVLTLLEFLSHRGWTVTVHALRNRVPAPVALPPAVRVVYFPRLSETRTFASVFRLIRRLRLESVIAPLDAAAYIARCLLAAPARRKVDLAGQRVAIGVDRVGALAAYAHQLFSGTPYVWLSLELDDIGRPLAFAPLRHVTVGAAFRRASGVLIQDQERLHTLCEFYQHSHPRGFFLPNAPAGPAQAAQVSENGNFFRRRFGLRVDQYPHILLHAGLITDDFLSREVAASFASLEGCALIFHERTRRSHQDAFIQSLQEVNRSNLFLSLSPVPFEDIDSVYSAATIGLAFYRPVSKDMAEIALASGKLAFYLRHGKPVLMNDVPSLRRLLEKYKIGLIIADLSNTTEVRAAIREILRNYDMYSHNARRCFAEMFDVQQKIEPVLDFLDQLSGRLPNRLAPSRGAPKQ